MLRSEVNQILAEGDAFIRSFGYVPPPFAYWTPAQMKANRAAKIIEGRLGWDVTDFGTGNFSETGLLLFTARNLAIPASPPEAGLLYAEKIMVVRDRQLTPMHRHIRKKEDIINRGGGELVLQLYNAGRDGEIDMQSTVSVSSDGDEICLGAGAKLSLGPGQSVTLLPNVWHSFWGDGDVLVGEVSTYNDDLTDNIFAQEQGRFSRLQDDEEPLYLLVSDYDVVFGA